MKVFLSIFLWLGCTAAVFSQTRAPEDSLLFLTGTTYAENGHHAWLLWQAQDTELLQGRSYAIYRKKGLPSSGHAFTRVALVQPTTRAAFLDARIDALPAGLANKAMVSDTIAGLFGDLMPSSGLSLGSQLSALLQTAATEPEFFNRLYFLSRTEPAVATALGTGVLVPMPDAVSTFEVRAQPDGGHSPGVAYSQVIGRVILDRNNVTSIAAPGPPVVIPDESPQGHLNVALRWGVPDELKRDTPLTYGYGVYRMEKAFAEANDHDITPPTPSELQDYLSNNADRVQQVHLLPVLPTQLLTPSEAALIPLDGGADPDFREPYFILDDNRAQAENKPKFQDGEQLYYYIASLDILGRPAAISDGTLVTFCHRHPPLVPVAVEVSNDYHYDTASETGDTHLAVEWNAPETIPEPSFYLVYRWESIEEMKEKVNDSVQEAAHLISGQIPHQSDISNYQFIDDGSGSPGLPNQAGRTFWYTVKAVLDTACGDLPSGHSAPGWGVLRDREGPLEPGGTVTSSVLCPDIKKIGEVETGINIQQLGDLFEGNPQGSVPLIFRVEATDPGITHLQINLLVISDNVVVGEQNLGQKALKPSATSLDSYRWVPAATISNQSNVFVEICARNEEGKTVCERFPLAGLPYQNTDPPSASRICFEVCQIEVITEEDFGVSSGGNGFHSPTDPDGEPNPIEFTFTATPETQEYKLYERIDAGPLVMIDQGVVNLPGSEVTVTDYEHPAHASVVCYFLQFFDRHGNPSPMTLVRCIRMKSRVEMPTPLLSQVEHAGDSNTPQGLLRWSCEPNGVERFLIGIGDGLSSIEMVYSPELTANTFQRITGSFGTGISIEDVQTGDLINEVQHRDFQTGRIGGNFGNPALPGQFEITLDLLPGRDYHFYIKALSPAGDVGEPSNIVNFVWTESGPPTGPQVPWPARSLPPIDEDFIDGVKAQMIDLDSLTVGPAAMIKIGSVDYIERSEVESGRIIVDGLPSFRPSQIPDFPGYSFDIFTTPEGESLLPFALYRYQVPNVYFPLVSGDVAQVAPLLERLRLNETTDNGVDVIEIEDPLITVATDPDDPKKVGLYLIDSQGVVEGYSYIYLLVRFSENGEVDRTIPTNTLFVPFY